MTVGLPPSTTATTEFVVPRSMPITLAMICPAPFLGVCFVRARYGCTSFRSWRGLVPPPNLPRLNRRDMRLQDVDLDLARLHFLDLRQRHRQHTVAIGRLHLVGLHRHRDLDRAFEV